MKLLILAPHADDETLGVGGTIARAAKAGHETVVAVLTGYGEGKHPYCPADFVEETRAQCRQAAAVLGVSNLIFRELNAGLLDNTPVFEINEVVKDLIEEQQPDELYIPFTGDLHRDHGAIAYAASVATRPYLVSATVKRVIAYETLSETHLAPPYLQPAFQPNLFVDISEHLETKLAAMSEYRLHLRGPNEPRSLRCLQALAELRGAHVGVHAAEAFVLLREVL